MERRLAAAAAIGFGLLALLCFALMSNVRAAKAQDAEVVSIVLKERVDVASGMVSLADIASIDGESADAERIQRVIVCRAPSSAEGSEVVAGRIKRALMRSGISAESFVIEGERVMLYLASYSVNTESSADSDADKAEPASTTPAQASDKNASYSDSPKTTMRVIGADGESSDAQDADKRRDDERRTVQAPAASEPAKPEAAQTKASNDGAYVPGSRIAAMLRERQGGHVEPVSTEPATDVVDIVLREIRQDTAKLLKLDAADVEITEMRRNAQLQQLPKGAQRLATQKEKLNLGADLGELRYRFSAEVDGELYNDLVLTVRATRFQKVVVFARDVRARSPIGEADLMLQRLPFESKATNYYTSIEDALGMAPRSFAKAGATVEPADLERAILIKRGDLVVLTYRSNALVLECRAKALSDGARGDLIQFERVSAGPVKSNKKPEPTIGIVKAPGRADVAAN